MVELQTDIQQLERTLGEAREEQQLLLQYPDLNGPVNTDLQGQRTVFFIISFASHSCCIEFTHRLSRFVVPTHLSLVQPTLWCVFIAHSGMKSCLADSCRQRRHRAGHGEPGEGQLDTHRAAGDAEQQAARHHHQAAAVAPQDVATAAERG